MCMAVGPASHRQPTDDLGVTSRRAHSSRGRASQRVSVRVCPTQVCVFNPMFRHRCVRHRECARYQTRSPRRLAPSPALGRCRHLCVLHAFHNPIRIVRRHSVAGVIGAFGGWSPHRQATPRAGSLGRLRGALGSRSRSVRPARLASSLHVFRCFNTLRRAAAVDRRRGQCIAAAYWQADLLQPDGRSAVRGRLRQYLSARLEASRLPRVIAGGQEFLAAEPVRRSEALQSEIWQSVIDLNRTQKSEICRPGAAAEPQQYVCRSEGTEFGWSAAST